MDVQHLEYDDEGLVRAALQAAYPTERPVFSQRRGAQIIRAAAMGLREGGDRRRPFVGGRIAASVAAAFTLFAGTAGAASAALPGEPLYPIKQVVERAMVAISGDDVQAARLELRFAERRLREAAAIPSDADDELSSALTDRFHAHLHAATSLAGEQVAGDVEQLEQSRDEQDGERARETDDTGGAAHGGGAGDGAPDIIGPKEHLDAQVVVPTSPASPSPSPWPSPSPRSLTPSPQPTSPAGPASPVPTATADPASTPSPAPSGTVGPGDLRPLTDGADDLTSPAG